MTTPPRSSIIGLPRFRHVVVILVVGVLTFAAGVLVVWLLLNGEWTVKASIGDALNILTAFFTTLAFTAVVLSLWYQQKELRVTLEELQKSDENTRASIEAIREQTEATRWRGVVTYRPYVIARLVLDSGSLLKLVIENTGRTAARNLRLSTDHTKPYPGWPEEYSVLANAYVFQNQIDTLAPGHRMFFIIASGSAIHKEDPDFVKHPPTFSVTARYGFDGAEEPVEERTVIDMRMYRMSFIAESSTEKELEKIRKELTSISQHVKTIASKSK